MLLATDNEGDISIRSKTFETIGDVGRLFSKPLSGEEATDSEGDCAVRSKSIDIFGDGVLSESLSGDEETEDNDGEFTLNRAKSFSTLSGEVETEEGELEGLFWAKLLFNILAGDKDGDRIITLFRSKSFNTLGEVEAEDSTFLSKFSVILGEAYGDEAQDDEEDSLSL